jgi:hypothetical protein
LLNKVTFNIVGKGRGQKIQFQYGWKGAWSIKTISLKKKKYNFFSRSIFTLYSKWRVSDFLGHKGADFFFTIAAGGGGGGCMGHARATSKVTHEAEAPSTSEI